MPRRPPRPSRDPRAGLPEAPRDPRARGRGAGTRPGNRFSRRSVELDPDELDALLAEDAREGAAPDRSVVRHLASRSAVARNDSPDIPFDASLNPYRGCEVGCAYCYARPTHETLGHDAGLDWERVVYAKRDAPALLERELRRPSWRPATLAVSGVTDPYQPAETRLRVTRGCLEVLARFRQPVAIITKRATVLRDLDLLAELAAHDAVRVTLSVTSLDEGLLRRLEPRASSAAARLGAVRRLAEAGVPVGVNVAPVIPGLTDHEAPAIVAAAADAGAAWAGMTMLRLPGAVREVFDEWLEREAPERRARVLARVREMRGGRLNDPRTVERFRTRGAYADGVRALLRAARARAGLAPGPTPPSGASFRVPGAGVQPGLFDGLEPAPRP